MVKYTLPRWVLFACGQTRSTGLSVLRWKKMRGGRWRWFHNLFTAAFAVCPVTTVAIKRAWSDFFSIQGHSLCPSRLLLSSSSGECLQIFADSNSRGQGARAKPQLENSACASSSLALPLSRCLSCRALPSPPFSIHLFSVPYPLPSSCCSPLSFCTHIVPALCGPCTTNSLQRVFTRKYKGQK